MSSTTLIELISSVVTENPPAPRVGEFVSLCRKIAVVQLRRKAAAGKLNPEFFRVSLEDLALDCVADVLQRDDEGRLVQVATYFESVSFRALREEDLLVHLRRLVYGRVNHSLFRLYNELDPSLGKVLRNVKLALQSLPTVQVVDRLGEQFMVPSLCESLEHLPPIGLEALEARIREFFHECRQMPQLIGKLASIVRDQAEHSRLVPVMALALAVRAIHAGDNEAAGQVQEAQERIHAEDTAMIIALACRKVSKEGRSLYVAKKQVCAEIYEKYVQVIESNLHQRILGQDGEADSYFEGLKALVPGLTQERYREEHRARVEYLGRRAFEEVRAELKKHML